MKEHIVPFEQLTAEELAKFNQFNWLVNTRNGREITNWSSVVDSRYGTFRHLAIFPESGQPYDKIDLEWIPAAFVVVYRQKGDRTEFLLPTERRVLLKDENGDRGNVYIKNIPQGLVRVWQGETADQAALREVKEEVGIEPKSISKMDELYLDAANSSSSMPFYLAEVDANELQQYIQSLDDTEDIKVSEADWYAIEDIQYLRIQCAKTLSGVLLATGFLGIWPKSKETSQAS